jgi:hypothetical protein
MSLKVFNEYLAKFQKLAIERALLAWNDVFNNESEVYG